MRSGRDVMTSRAKVSGQWLGTMRTSGCACAKVCARLMVSSTAAGLSAMKLAMRAGGRTSRDRAAQPAAVGGEEHRTALRLRQHADLPARVSWQEDQQQRAVAEIVTGRAKPWQQWPVECVGERSTTLEIRRQQHRQEATTQRAKSGERRNVLVGGAQADVGRIGKIAQSSDVIGVEVRDEDQPDIRWAQAKCVQLACNGQLRADEERRDAAVE